MNAQQRLDELAAKIRRDTSLPLSGEYNLVFGEGNPEAILMFIGEAPGKNEDEQQRPFVGRSGKLLDTWIASLGLSREDVYITNIVKRRPPDNRDPLPAEIDAYAPFLGEQIDIIRPQIIAPLGRFATQYFLPEAKISRDQGSVFVWGEYQIMPIFHPAAAMRSTKVMQATHETFAKLKLLI